MTVQHVGQGQLPAAGGDPVKIRRAGTELDGIRTGYYAIRSPDEWRGAWSKGDAPTLPAALESARSMLIVGVSDEPDVVQFKIAKVSESGSFLHVLVKATHAGDKCAPPSERSNSDAVVAPRSDKPLKFYVEDERAETCGDAPLVKVNCHKNEDLNWTPKVVAQPGDTVTCEMSAEARGRFALIDNSLSIGALPGGSQTKLTFSKGTTRGAMVVDIFGTYVVRAETKDESGRIQEASASVDVLPPKTTDVLVQLVWTNVDASDDPDTFPRVKLRAASVDTKNTTLQTCSLESPRPELCDAKTRGVLTHMRLHPSAKRVALDVAYLDERVEKGPVLCAQLFFDGARTGEVCDQSHRNPDERWKIGTLDMPVGTLEGTTLVTGADGGAPSSGTNDGGASPAVRAPLPPQTLAKPPIPPIPPIAPAH